MIGNRDRLILQKIGNYIHDVTQYIDGFSFDDFMKDKKTISACAFSVSQIGELENEVSAETQTQYPNIPWKSIRGMRNRIVHDYENVDLSVLWGTITTSLIQLGSEIEALLVAKED